MKPKHHHAPSISLPVLFMPLFLALPGAHAAVTITLDSGTSPFAVSGSDLLQTDLGAAPVVTGNFANFNSGGETVLRDGNDGGTGVTVFPTTALVGTGAAVTYALDVGANPLGYTLTQINTSGAWDGGRDAQNINILYSTVDDPATFVSLAVFAFDPTPNPFSRISATPGIGDAFIATDVHSIRFEFPNQENGAGGYRELDVVGFAVPEPSSTGLLIGTGALAMALGRSRHKK